MTATLELRLRICTTSGRAMGPGKASLLEAIQAAGSISGAARELGMSYRRAWELADAMNQDFKEPLVTTTRGGAGRGGATVTALGLAVLAQFRDMEAAALLAAQAHLKAMARHLAPAQQGR
jgi:molybdate transport system regulatory protein